MWFRSGVRLGCEGRSLVVAARDEFLLDRLRRQFARDLEAVGTQLFGGSPTIHFVVDMAAEDAAEKPVVSHADPAKCAAGARPVKSAEDAGSRTRSHATRFARLDGFVVGEGNRVAVTAARSLLARPGSVSPLFLYGPTGSGKTRLLEGIWTEFRAQPRMIRVLLLSAEQFTSHFLEALQGSGLPSFRRKVRDVDVLLIDDLQFFTGKRATIQEMQHTVDSLLRQGRQLVLAADRAPGALKGLTPDFVGRLSGGLVCGIEPADYATRLGIARQMAQAMGSTIPDNVLELIAARLQGDARQISGALNRLRATSEALQRPITYEFAGEALEDVFRSTHRFVHLADIERAVCEVFGVDGHSLRENRKAKAVTHPRMLAMWLARKYTRSAFSEIGDYFGRRSHSTVISAEKKVNGWMAKGVAVQLGHGLCRVEEAIRRIESHLRTG